MIHLGQPMVRRTLAAWLMVSVVGLGGCGPIEYINQVTRRASSEVEAARAARADKFAPYEYTLAVEYLNKAREEAAAADYQAANRFGRKSATAAAEARALAVARSGDPARAERELPPKNLPKSGAVKPLDDEPAEPGDPGGTNEVPSGLGGDR